MHSLHRYIIYNHSTTKENMVEIQPNINIYNFVSTFTILIILFIKNISNCNKSNIYRGICLNINETDIVNVVNATNNVNNRYLQSCTEF